MPLAAMVRLFVSALLDWLGCAWPLPLLGLGTTPAAMSDRTMPNKPRAKLTRTRMLKNADCRVDLFLFMGIFARTCRKIAFKCQDQIYQSFQSVVFGFSHEFRFLDKQRWRPSRGFRHQGCRSVFCNLMKFSLSGGARATLAGLSPTPRWLSTS